MIPKSHIIAPGVPEPDVEMLEAKGSKAFDGDGFLAKVWHPARGRWIDRVPFRFAFIDAPEVQQPFGLEAKEFLHELIAGKSLRLMPRLKQSSGYVPIDGYMRMLCMGFLTEAMPTGEVRYFKDGKCQTGVVKNARLVTRNIELEMVVNGWAWVMEQYAFEREEAYCAAQEDARREKRGLWAMDNPEPPWRFKQREKRRRLAEQRQPNLFGGNT